MRVGIAEQLIENPRLAFLALSLLGPLAHHRGELTCQERCHQKDEQRYPFLPACNRKGIERWNKEVIKGKKGSNRRKDGSIPSKRTREQEYHQQVDKGNVRNLWVKLEQ